MPDKLTPNATAPARTDLRNAPRRFYLAMSLLMLALVTYGFSRTIGPNLLHAQRPARTIILLGIHGAVFYGWMLLLIAQAALVRSRRIRLHRWLGWFGAADAVLVIIMGLWASFHQPAPLAAEMLGVVSMAGFGIPVALAIFWRKNPPFHRRLLFIGTAVLTNAAFARFPGTYLPNHFFYAGTDVIIAAGIAHDIWQGGRIHAVYRYAAPLLFAAEIAVLIPAWPYLG
jgi:drug/metabolite transporter (DMT)-like permease